MTNETMTTLTGSEKQVAWAESIRTAALDAADMFIADLQARPDFDAENPQHAACLARAQRIRTAIASAARAADIIDTLSAIRTQPRDLREKRENAMFVMGKHFSQLPKNAAQAAILDKPLR